ncbi:MAG: tautomerase family protein [Candidatus Methanomethylophilaceae archaeon]|nr:tautomerase family protein [Candidatus Methanomethylophilaceae archaeon]
MPSITVDIAPLTKEQKAQISKEFTESISKVTGIDAKAFYIFFNEYPKDSFAVGGTLFSERQ